MHRRAFFSHIGLHAAAAAAGAVLAQLPSPTEPRPFPVGVYIKGSRYPVKFHRFEAWNVDELDAETIAEILRADGFNARAESDSELLKAYEQEAMAAIGQSPS